MEQKNIFKETIFVKIGYSVLRFFFRPVVKLFWIKRVEGKSNIPISGPFLIAANHSSYFDFFCLMAIFPQKIYFLAAEKFFRGKIWGPLMKMTGQIKVERDSKDKSNVYDLVLSALKQGKIIGIFPEGTRSPDGEIHKTFTGIAKFALMAKVKVIPVGIKGTFDVLPRQSKFPKFKKVIELKIGQPMDFSEYYGDNISDIMSDEAKLRKITDEVMAQISTLSSLKI